MCIIQGTFIILLVTATLLVGPASAAGTQRRPWCYGGATLCGNALSGPRYLQASAHMDGALFLHGGRKSPTSVLPSHTIDVVDLKSRVTTEYSLSVVARVNGTLLSAVVPTTTMPGGIIPPIYGHMLIPWSSRRLVMYGGTILNSTNGQQPFTDLYIIDTTAYTAEYRKLNPGEVSVLGRCMHACMSAP